MTTDSGEAVGAGKLTQAEAAGNQHMGVHEKQPDCTVACVHGKLTLEMEFVACVKEMHDWAWRQSSNYINREQAAPFIAGLPEFWREPARVMACVGYYASADEWMKQHVEGEA